MTRLARLSAAALIGAGTLASSGAEARGGGAIAAGLIGGLAAGALIGAATQAHAGPAYGYAPAPVYYRPAPADRGYEDGPAYGLRRAVAHDRGPDGYGYGYGRARHGDWDWYRERGEGDGYGRRGW